MVGQYEYHSEDKDMAPNRRPAAWIAEFRGLSWVLSWGDFSLVDEITDRDDVNSISQRLDEAES